jgi:hypothetical protein
MGGKPCRPVENATWGHSGAELKRIMPPPSEVESLQRRPGRLASVGKWGSIAKFE